MSSALHSTRSRVGLWTALVFVLGCAVGLPSLRGEFLSGDDYHLVLNHVLVNHPSWAHAFELLTIVHRDLYQPIPLLSFSLDFAIVDALGLNPSPTGPNAGGWVFHLTNTLFHALNGVLVLLLIRRLTGRLAVAVVAAVLFVVHPLSAEPIAWLNGRMMLLSACFTFAALLAFDRWDEKPTVMRAIAAILLTLFAHMSKVSAAIPILIIVFTVYRRRKPPLRWWFMWCVVTVITGAFAAFAASSSRTMMDEAREVMSAPPPIYCLMALGQYFRQFLVPIGLSPWYPPPVQIGWTDSRVLTAGAIVAAVLIAGLLSLRRTRVGVLGLTWFLFAVAPTLPIVPTRRSIGADRYVYIPNVGLAWIAAAAVIGAYLWYRRRGSSIVVGNDPSTAKANTWIAYGMAGVPVIAALVYGNWFAQSHYATNVAQGERIIATNPDYPGVYEATAWAHFRNGDYADAIRLAQEDIARHPIEMACKVYQVVGMSQLRLGRAEEAIATLRRAVSADPEYGKAYSRLAKALMEVGTIDEAIVHYERAAEIMPLYNPGLLNLANAYRRVGRMDDAFATYERVIKINSFDVTAQLALAEMEIERERFESAATRFQQLLDWMPENTVAWTNLGVVHERMNEPTLAEEAYLSALARDHDSIVALLNLTDLRIRAGRVQDAHQVFAEFVPYQLPDARVVSAYHDFTLLIGEPLRSAEAFQTWWRMQSPPRDDRLRRYAAYAFAQHGHQSRAVTLLQAAGDDVNHDTAIVDLTRVLVALYEGSIDAAIENVGRVLRAATPDPPDAVDRLIADMQRLAVRDKSSPWPYLITAKALSAQGQPAFARLALDECEKRCTGNACRGWVASMRSELAE